MNTQKIRIPQLSSKMINVKRMNTGMVKDRSSELDILLFQNSSIRQYSQTQKGSRKIQKMLSIITPDKMDILVGKLGSFLPELMKNKYGNYLCQKLFAKTTSKQREFIIEMVSF
jgi:hypothetical protein